MRGKGKETRTECYNQRITPAYAGKSFIIDCRLQAVRDHPRLCGEKSSGASSTIWKVGSPPPMRGKETQAVPNIKTSRITPAYAGKSFLRTFPCPFPQDHPRLCGEKSIGLTAHGTCWGSPPPMRGKARNWTLWSCRKRITPAYAGKSLSTDSSVFKGWDHPRLCGEKKLLGVLLSYFQGSPPPMRGKGQDR